MWTPFGQPAAGEARRGGEEAEAQAGDKPAETNEISELKAQLANMQQKIDKLSEDRD